jgi:hypothetical protein
MCIVDLFLIPAQLVILGFFKFRTKIAKIILGLYKRIFQNLAITWISNLFCSICDIKMEIGNWKKSILLPIVISILGYMAIKNCFDISIHPITDLLFSIDSWILAPIVEQILQGVCITAFFFLLSKIFKSRQLFIVWWIFSLIFSSCLLTIGHVNNSPLEWEIRFFSFLYYGLLYCLYKQNLLPAIIAHATWNILLFLPF